MGLCDDEVLLRPGGAGAIGGWFPPPAPLFVLVFAEGRERFGGLEGLPDRLDEFGPRREGPELLCVDG